MSIERDGDLQAFFDAADHIGAAGVRALVDRLQQYRLSARTACNHIDAMQQNSGMVSNVEMLRAKIDSINNYLASWQWEMELDHLEVSDYTDAL